MWCKRVRMIMQWGARGSTKWCSFIFLEMSWSIFPLSTGQTCLLSFPYGYLTNQEKEKERGYQDEKTLLLQYCAFIFVYFDLRCRFSQRDRKTTRPARSDSQKNYCCSATRHLCHSVFFPLCHPIIIVCFASAASTLPRSPL